MKRRPEIARNGGPFFQGPRGGVGRSAEHPRRPWTLTAHPVCLRHGPQRHGCLGTPYHGARPGSQAGTRRGPGTARRPHTAAGAAAGGRVLPGTKWSRTCTADPLAQGFRGTHVWSAHSCSQVFSDTSQMPSAEASSERAIQKSVGTRHRCTFLRQVSRHRLALAAAASAAAADVAEICFASSGSSIARYGFSGSVRWVFNAMQYLAQPTSQGFQSQAVARRCEDRR